MYIADGHHRSASSVLLAKNKKTNSSNHFMSFLIDETQLNINNFNRLIKKIDDFSEKEFLQKLKTRFHLKKNNDCIPQKHNELGMYLRNNYYLLKLKKDTSSHDCVNKLAPSILSNNILKPILNIKDERTNRNIKFLDGNIPLSEIKKKVDSGDFKIAFI